jgi:catechol 2,3-dioxygenase-like lactoylglutathione lyase family enzyme
MNVQSISGLNCYVEDLDRTARFYEAIGFRRGKEKPGRITFYVNWFFVTSIAQDHEAEADAGMSTAARDKRAGQFVFLKVEDIDAFHEGLVAKGIEPAGEPQKRSSGNRELLVRDPDGYGFVFFQKK